MSMRRMNMQKVSSRKQCFVVVGALLAAMSVACSGPFRSHKNNAEAPKNEPRTDLNNDVNPPLPPEVQNKFEEWKRALVKSCDAASAVQGTPAQNGVGIDGRRFLETNGRSLALRGEQGEFAYFGEPTTLQGASTSTVENAVTINGVADKSTLTAERADGNCKIFVNGQLVYETVIWETLPVVAFGRGAVESPYKNEVAKADDTNIFLRNIFSGVVRVLHANLLQGRWLDTMLQAKFPELSGAQISKLFLGSRLTSEKFAAWAAADGTNTVIANLEFPALSGEDKPIKKMAEKQGSVELQARITPPKIQIGDVKNDADTQLWGITAVMTWETVLGSRGQGDEKRLYSVTSISANNGEPRSNARFVACLNHRARYGWPLNLARVRDQRDYDNPQTPPPYYVDLVTPCLMFVDNSAEAMATDAEFPVYIRKMFRESFQQKCKSDECHRGWDQPLKLVAKYYVDHGESIVAKLSPRNDSRFIEKLDKYYGRVVQAVSTRPALTKHRDKLLDQLAYPWAVRYSCLNQCSSDSDSTPLDDRQIDLYFDAMANVIDALPSSTDAWLSAIVASKAGDQDANEKIAKFALSLTPEVKAQLVEGQSLAMAAGLNEFVDKYPFGTFLQYQPKHAQPKDWVATVAALKDFQIRDRARATEKEQESFSYFFHELANIAIYETWSQEKFQQLEALTPLARYKREYGTDFENIRSAAHIAVALRLGTFSTIYDTVLGIHAARYVALAAQLDGKLKELSADSSLQYLVSDVASAFYRPIWRGAEDQPFWEAAKELLQLLDQLHKADATQRDAMAKKIRYLIEP